MDIKEMRQPDQWTVRIAFTDLNSVEAQNLYCHLIKNYCNPGSASDHVIQGKTSCDAGFRLQYIEMFTGYRSDKREYVFNYKMYLLYLGSWSSYEEVSSKIINLVKDIETSFGESGTTHGSVYVNQYQNKRYNEQLFQRLGIY